MEIILLLRAGLKRHRGGLAGVFGLIFLVSLCLACVLAVWSNSERYIREEIRRAGFGDLTAWVSGLESPEPLAAGIAASPVAERVESQRVIYTPYVLNAQESDSEGQLILYRPEETRYRFFTPSLSGYAEQPSGIAAGEVYVSPSLISMFGAKLGEEIAFPIARSGRTLTLRIAGWYEDPFMGSSMIGMKGFLIGESSRAAALTLLENAGIDARARDGAMFHIFSADPMLSVSQLEAELNRSTSLPLYTEFVHSEGAISGFMLVLQNAFGGFLLAFSAVLLLAAMAALGHQLQSGIQQDFVNMGILKTMGITSGKLRMLQLMQYLAAILPAMVLGLLLAGPVCKAASAATLTTTGIWIPCGLPPGLCLTAFGLVLAVLVSFLLSRLQRIAAVTPMKAIRGELGESPPPAEKLPPISGHGLLCSLALRQLLTGKARYAGACLVAVLLVFFASLVGRMDSWLGPDGKGMMDAFNPADHDLGIQSFGMLGPEQFEQVIRSHTGITDVYRIAMPSVHLEGTEYTANVITEPERFHLLEGRPCARGDEIVITEFVAADRGLAIGDSLMVGADLGEAEYIVSGIYSCANDMGQNVGMNREGYLRIGSDHPGLWCWHYFLSDPSQKAVITEELEAAYGGDIHIHENTWPGLSGIIAAMRGLVVVLYGMVVLFILTVTAMSGKRLLAAEQRNQSLYRALGFSVGRLRLTFALRFGIAAALGAIPASVLAAALTDPLVSAAMKLAGISSFASHPQLGTVLFPGAAVVLLFFAFGWLFAGKIGRASLTALAAEQ